jgi:hypothetical protein
MWDSPFKTGELLMEQTPSQNWIWAGETPLLMGILVTVFVVLALLELRNFLHVGPFLWDSVFRARGSVALENNVRVARERNQLTLILMIPAILFMYRYSLYNPRFIQALEGNWRLLAITGVFLGYFALRFTMYLILRPKRRADHYRMAHRAGFTFFILLMLPALATVTILFFFKASDLTIRNFLYVEALLFYLIFLVRKAQILSLSCNPLRTFLYLCGLEILPTGILCASAVLL